MRHDLLDQIPPPILQSVRHHLEVIHDFNTEVLRTRDLERRFGSPGRYEWEYRRAREPQAQASTTWLARFAAQAATLLPWSDAAHQWRTP